MHHVVLFISSMINKGYCGKITHVSDYMPIRHITTIGKFLSKSSWNEDCIERALKRKVINQI
ncbi:hypothetical protein OSC52_02565 [Clostridium pasteurianum]|uniref:hypothetical protein n=1 Tax=Clostridium pasteurianum TaxID=1501 RepID=UPI002260C2B2|nr:hypothetical protein [Clostridium pasteurianum]UZW14748.1 hypothetical protein OSC52_02565 [Clostridium pasteurianum]